MDNQNRMQVDELSKRCEERIRTGKRMAIAVGLIIGLIFGIVLGRDTTWRKIATDIDECLGIEQEYTRQELIECISTALTPSDGSDYDIP